MEHTALDLIAYLLHALAGGAGGAIRWASASTSWQKGLGHILIGAIAGTFLGGLMFGIVRPAADLAGMAQADGELLGAHLAGLIGMNLYAVLPDLVVSWLRSKASPPPEPTP